MMGAMNQDFRRLATAVVKARELRGWRQTDLATAAGVGISSVQNLEAGRQFSRMPPSLRRIEAALGWEEGSAVATLQGGEPTPKQQPTHFEELVTEDGEHVLIEIVTALGPLTAAERREALEFVRYIKARGNNN
jgi:transcriptional regulator with XRE-family HTH domain